MRISTWNVRGMNDAHKVTEIKKFLSHHSVCVAGLLETRVKQHKFGDISRKLGRNWTWVTNYNFSHKGRIWVGWQSTEVDVRVISTHEQFIHLHISTKQQTWMAFVTVVYGLHSVEDRKDLWSQLTNIAQCLGDNPWLLLGDFNAVLHLKDRINGSPVTLYEVKDFAQFMDDVGCTVLKSSGWKFSRSNKATSGPECSLLLTEL